jgi:hypothetical protein
MQRTSPALCYDERELTLVTFTARLLTSCFHLFVCHLNLVGYILCVFEIPGSTPGGISAAGRIRSNEKSDDLIGNRIHDLPACSIVPQPTTLSSAPIIIIIIIIIIIYTVNRLN